jgi:phosphoadenosine phosphosulfate reductase|tara:strand:+ start:302 stop:1033 length:732 start_codon:yes stop_codon:yes gene_type:complete
MVQIMNKKTIQLDIENLNNDFKDRSPQQVLEWALEKFHPKIALASSFGAEDIVLIDMIKKINPNARIFTLETGRLHKETYDLMDKVKTQFGNLEVYYPDTVELEDMVRKHGVNLFYNSVEERKLCCRVRKIGSLNRALSNLDAWITGLRQDQAASRNDTPKVEVDSAHRGIIKINPIIDKTSEDIWKYIRENNLPYNALHDSGFPSIGCAPCTRAIKPEEDARAGRWWWEPRDQSECGLHVKS